MRTTLTIEEDVAELLKHEMRTSGESFKTVLNSCIRRGLRHRQTLPEKPAFRVKAKEMGLQPGINLDNVGELLEQIEGPEHR